MKKGFFPLNGKNKKKIYFFEVNTKNISSHVLKISAISLVLRTQKLLIFSTHSMKYTRYLPKKSKYPVFIHLKFECDKSYFLVIAK